MANLRETLQATHPAQGTAPWVGSHGGPHVRFGGGGFAPSATEPDPVGGFPMPRQARYASLDAWRGLACLLVVVLHSLFYCGAADIELAPEAQSSVLAIASRFWIGVPMFFVISGYCISAAVGSHRRREGNRGSYFVRRLRRIAPPYWCALGLTFAAVLIVERWIRPGLFCDTTAGFPDPASLNARQWFGNVSLIESWRHLVAGGSPSYFLGHAWTLFYEEQFYVVAGLLLLLAPRRFFLGAAVVTLLTLAARQYGHVINMPVQGSFLDGHWLMFAAGIAVYHFANHANAWQKGSTIALLAAGIVYASWDASLVWGLPNNFPSNALSAFTFALVLIVARRWDGAIMGARSLAPIRFCGTICYSLYLVHWPICKALSHLLHDAGVRGPWGAALVILPLCIAASVAAGYAFHVAVERRFLNPPAWKA
jgi:peptidoglycan/LPS O-acetylase OafA/YrhL